jgi:hypothetical protein
MKHGKEYRGLIQAVRELAAMPIDPADAQRAIDEVRRRLRKPAGPSEVNWFAGRWVWMGASVTAAAGIVVAIVLLTLPRTVDAAEALRATSQASRNYQGWVHVTMDISQDSTGIVRLIASDIHLHFNNSSGASVIEFRVFGSECITMFSPETGKEMEYIGLSGELQVSSLNKKQEEESRKRMLRSPVNPEDVIAQAKADGGPDPTVTKSFDQGMDRFDVVFHANSTTQPTSDREPSAGSMTVWSDPESNLIRKMTTIQDDGKPITMTFSYGDPQIRDIYDLGVPRSAKVVEINSPIEEAAPAVMRLPDTTKLVKNPAVSGDELQTALRKYADPGVGDFVSIDCQEECFPDGGRASHGMMTIIASQGDRGFNDRFEVGATWGFFGGAIYPAGWPAPKLADALLAAKRAFHDSIVIYNGNNIWGDVTSYIPDKQGRTHAVPTTQFSPKTVAALRTSELDLRRQIWPHIGQDISFRGQPKPFVEILLDRTRPELVVLRVKGEIPGFGASSTRPYYWWDDYYWLDPKRDYLPVESVEYSSDREDAPTHIVYLAFARLADGRWYPTHSQARTFFPASTGVSDPGYGDEWRQVLQDQKLEDQWFTDPAGRLKRAGSLFPAGQPTTK